MPDRFQNSRRCGIRHHHTSTTAVVLYRGLEYPNRKYSQTTKFNTVNLGNKEVIEINIYLQTLQVGANGRSAQELQNGLYNEAHAKFFDEYIRRSLGVLWGATWAWVGVDSGGSRAASSVYPTGSFIQPWLFGSWVAPQFDAEFAA